MLVNRFSGSLTFPIMWSMYYTFFHFSDFTFFSQNAKCKCTYESNKQSLQGQEPYWVTLNMYERNFDINKYRILYLKSAVRNYFDTSR